MMNKGFIIISALACGALTLVNAAPETTRMDTTKQPLTTTVSPQKQPDMTTQTPASGTVSGVGDLQKIIDQMTMFDKIKFIADYLYNNPAIYQHLEDSLLAALSTIDTEPENGLVRNAVLPWLLEQLPGFLRDPEVVGIAKIFMKDVNMVPITSDFYLHSGNRSQDMDYFVRKLFQRLDCSKMVHEGLALKAAAAAAMAGSKPTTPPGGSVCYRDTKSHLMQVVFGVPMAMTGHPPVSSGTLVG